MEDLPEIKRPVRIPITIVIPDYARDHVFRDQAVFPAVEAMRILAQSAAEFRSSIHATRIINADFDKFLNIDYGVTAIEAINEVEVNNNGSVTSRLVTVRKSEKTLITRKIEHVSLTFAGIEDMQAEPPLDATLGLEGVCLHLDKNIIYRDLVPFKSAYQNINTLHVSENGALAFVNGGTAEAPPEPLGSPFPLDATFHAACVWGQRYRGIVGFPVHLDLRIIRRKTRAGENYISSITPVKTDGGVLVFNLWIYDQEGNLCEEVRGLHMKDVSGKTLLPPAWIIGDKENPLESIRTRCIDLSLIELETVTEHCEKILSGPERERFASMKGKRRKNFCGARLALKKLSRRLPGGDMLAPPDEITTIQADGLPRCPRTNGVEPLYCTASHDSRFAVAAVSEKRIGIDVEEISERVLKGRHHYMHDEEQSLVKSHPIGEIEASTRVWSIKEAVTKATGLNLAQAWKRTAVLEVGEEKSVMLIDHDRVEAIHAVVDGHLFTMISI
jgi:phosphopantetheinyl transferase